MSPIVVRTAQRADLPGILAVQRDAFGRVARELSIPPAQLPPLIETLSDFERLMDSGTRFLVAMEDSDKIIGSVRSTLHNGTVEIGRLVVAAPHTRCGVATMLMDVLEASYPDAIRFELFTGADAEAPLSLYASRGYGIDRTDRYGPVELVWLAKPGPAALR